MAGNVTFDQIKMLSEKWFGSIPGGQKLIRDLPREPDQTEARSKKVKRDVPVDAIYKVYHMCKREDDAFYSADLMSDIMSTGRSSRFHNELLKKKKLFSEVDAYITADRDNGLFVVTGKLHNGINMMQAEKEIELELEKIKMNLVLDVELHRVKNKMESMLVFQEVNLLNKAMNLCSHELMWGAEQINTEINKYMDVTKESINKVAGDILRTENCSTLYYYSN